MTRSSTKYLSGADFARAGVIMDAFGITFGEMEEDLRDLVVMTSEDFPDLPELPDGPVDLLLNNVQQRGVDSRAAAQQIERTVKLGSSFAVNADKGFADPARIVEITREVWSAVKGFTPFDSGVARAAVTYVKGRAGGNLGTTQLTMTTWISERDLQDPLDVVGVVSPVDYASVLEIRGFTRTRVTPVRRAFNAASRKYKTEVGMALRFIPSDQVGRANYPFRKGYKGVTRAGIPTGGVYNVPVILVGQLGVQIEQFRRRRTAKPSVARARIKTWRR